VTSKIRALSAEMNALEARAADQATRWMPKTSSKNTGLPWASRMKHLHFSGATTCGKKS
jgi:hypothetical protein